MLGEKDAAFAALEQASAAGSHVDVIKLEPKLDNLRSDPRYTPAAPDRAAAVIGGQKVYWLTSRKVKSPR
jgi:hypothetical protein